MTARNMKALQTDELVYRTIQRLRNPAGGDLFTLPNDDDILTELASPSGDAFVTDLIKDFEWRAPCTDRTVYESIQRLIAAGAIVVVEKHHLRHSTQVRCSSARAEDYLRSIRPSERSRKRIRREFRKVGLLKPDNTLDVDQLLSHSWLYELLKHICERALSFKIYSKDLQSWWTVGELLAVLRRLKASGIELDELDTYEPADRRQALQTAYAENVREGDTMTVDDMMRMIEKIMRQRSHEFP